MSDLAPNYQTDEIKSKIAHLERVQVALRVYKLLDFYYSPPVMEAESAEYGAYKFELNGLSVRFRVAKITPTKIGQFVTLWKRAEKGPIQPYDMADAVDFIIINTHKDAHCGQFVFPKSVLCQQAIFSIDGKGGKRAIRVYPPWDIPVNRQAQKTQEWQLKYFLEIPKDKEIDVTRARLLYGDPQHADTTVYQRQQQPMPPYN